MSNDFKYVYQKALLNPDYMASALGPDMRDEITENESEFAICVFPNANEDIHVMIPVMPMVDNLIEDYGDEAKQILVSFMAKLKERIEKI